MGPPGDAVILIKSNNILEQFVREKYPTIPIIIRPGDIIFYTWEKNTDTIVHNCSQLLTRTIEQIIKDRPADHHIATNGPIVTPEVTTAAGEENNITTTIVPAAVSSLNVNDLMKAVADNFIVKMVVFDIKTSTIIFNMN